MESEPFTPEEQTRINEIASRIKTDPNSVTWNKPEPGEWTGRTMIEDRGTIDVVAEGAGIPEHLKRKPEEKK